MSEYYQSRKESIYRYYNANKDKIRARETQKVRCEICNCEMQKKHLIIHKGLVGT